MAMKNLRASHTIRPHSQEKGAALFEFALSFVFLMTMFFSVMEFGYAVYSYHFVAYAAQQGARYAIVRGAHWGNNTCASVSTLACNATATNVQDYVRSIAPLGMTTSSIKVTTTWPGTGPSGSTTGCTTTNSDGCMVQVVVSYPFAFNFPLVPQSTKTISATAEMVIQQ